MRQRIKWFGCLAAILLVAITISIAFLKSEANRDIRREYSINELERHAPVVAVLDRIDTFKIVNDAGVIIDAASLGFTTKSGEKFYVNSFRSNSDWIVGFAKTLQLSNAYELPSKLVDYEMSLRELRRVGQSKSNN